MSSAGPVRTRSGAPRWFVIWMGFITCVIAVLCAALCWELAALGDVFTKVLLWVGLSVVSVVALVFGMIGLIRYHTIQNSLAAPLMVTALAALVWFEMPQDAGWQVSRGILEDQSINCVNPGHHTLLGVYSITFITPRDGGCLFYAEGTSENSEGFAYFPADPPPSIGPPSGRGIEYQPFHGRWYRFVDSS
jgi:hypothetical protein